ncbi:VOC family protein [Niabella sp. W65]|nr:VOC family protein [Niabella sp. W65]MCH7366798.1 VOC family protein [Niabella sp. W65]ULT42505.1 VOC family protein [Niabella sp. I65]
MDNKILGLHHITAIAGNAQENLNFYTQVLGLRLVKKTVNFDDPGTYHFYYGNEEGAPGTILTFFPWQEYLKEEPAPVWQQRLPIRFLQEAWSFGKND